MKRRSGRLSDTDTRRERRTPFLCTHSSPPHGHEFPHGELAQGLFPSCQKTETSLTCDTDPSLLDPPAPTKENHAHISDANT